jgi:hypothetical protein
VSDEPKGSNYSWINELVDMARSDAVVTKSNISTDLRLPIEARVAKLRVIDGMVKEAKNSESPVLIAYIRDKIREIGKIHENKP